MDALLERVLVFALAASLVGLAFAVLGGFSAPVVLALAALLTFVYHRHARDAAPGDARMVLVLPILLVALLFRLPPSAYVLGGQDQGIYTNAAAELLRSGDIAITDPELPRIARHGAAARDAYLRDNYRDPFLPGVYTSKDGQRTLTMQFYHLLPVWLALAGGVFGMAWAGLGLTFLSLLSVLFFQRLAAELSGSARIGAVAGLLLALNPLHAFFSKFPVSEVPALAFACAGFALLARFLRATPQARRGRWLALSVAAFACLFLTRISGFMYLPLLWLIGAMAVALDADRARARAVGAWAAGCLAVYGVSVAYGLAWSRPYSLQIYEDSFGPLFGAHWLRAVAVLVALAIALQVAAWRALLTRALAWADARAGRWLGPLLLVLLAIALVRGWQLGFTDHYLGSGKLAQFDGVVAAGWESLAHLSLAVAALYACPLLFVLVLWVAQWRVEGAARMLLFFLANLFAYLALLNWIVPYQPYYARYLASEAVPLLLLCAALALGWARTPGARRVVAATLAASGVYFALLSAGQLGKREAQGAFASVARLAAIGQPQDLLLVDQARLPGYKPEEVRTALIYHFGRHAIAVSDEALLDTAYLGALEDEYGRVLVLSQSTEPAPGFEPAGAVALHALGFARGNLPPTRLVTTLDTTLHVFRMGAFAHAGADGANIEFRVVDDPRLLTQVGRRLADGSLQAQGTPGFLLYGPYVPLPAGRYRMDLLGTLAPGDAPAQVDVAVAQGSRVLGVTTTGVTGGETIAQLEFEVPESGVRDLEVRVQAPADSRLRVAGFRITRR